jgi:hypothetical protein
MKCPKESKRSLLESNQHYLQDQVKQVLHSNVILLSQDTFVENEAILQEIVSRQREAKERMPTMLLITIEEKTLHS